MKRGLIFLALCTASVAALIVAAVLALWATLAPAGGTWALPLRARILGRDFQREASVPVLLRLATHPLAVRLIDGRQVETAQGRWRLRSDTPRGLTATCAPCRVQIAALGPLPLQLDRVQLGIQADGADQYRGTLQLGAAPHTLTLHWRGRFERDGTMQLNAELPSTALADAVRVFSSTLPERDTVQVEGRLAATFSARLPRTAASPWQLQPRVEGFAVGGLGTERLLDLQRPAACRAGSDAANDSITGWLPRAVVAAEDQRFFEHPGYDLAALTDAWQQNQQAGAALVGASTITQQLAKLVVTGDERSATRKLRELLYAVEMERTLGKARILQLYLALAPWGEGVCGAERAVRVHLGLRDASAIGPVAAAWQASHLPAPDALLHAEQDRGEIDQERVARVIQGLRPMNLARRENAQAQMLLWSPPALRRPHEARPAATQASHEPSAPAPLESPTIVSPGAAANDP